MLAVCLLAQVIDFRAREAKRSKMPRLLRTFSSLKKERYAFCRLSCLMTCLLSSLVSCLVSYLVPCLSSSLRLHALQPWDMHDKPSLFFTLSFVYCRGSYILEDADTLVSLPQIQPLSPSASTPYTPRAMSLSRSVSGITTASSTASLIKVGQDPFGSSGGDVSPITPAQTEASSCYQRLKAENDILAEK